MAHKGKDGPYLFERDLSLDFSYPFNLYEKYFVNGLDFSAGGINPVPLVTWASEAGQADYTTGRIVWYWQYPLTGTPSYKIELAYQLTLDANMRRFESRIGAGTGWSAWTPEVVRPTSAKSFQLGPPWGAFINTGTGTIFCVYTPNFGLLPWPP